MERKVDFDSILTEIGYTGRTQNFYFALICFISFFTGSFPVVYVFTAGDLNYRCFINECDNSPIETADYNPEWLKYAVPFDEDRELPEKCLAHEMAAERNISRDYCAASDFNGKLVNKCGDKFVFETEEKTILTEFDLTCKENKWKLTLTGTVQSAGKFCNMLMIGYFSDRFGRKATFIVSAVIQSTFAVAQVLSPSYWWFMTFIFLETCLGGGTYTTAIVLGLELVSPRYRTAVGGIIFALGSAGTIYLGLSAMLTLNWKLVILLIYVPNFIIISYIWVLPESITWLHAKGRYKEIAVILLRIVKWNKLNLSEDALYMLVHSPEKLGDNYIDHDAVGANKKRKEFPILEIFRSRPMMLRLTCLAYCWLATLLIFYGLSLISVTIGGNKFIDFIIVSAIEIPASILITVISKRIGRKAIMHTGFFISGLALLIYTFVSQIYWIKMMLFMMGKFAITMSFSIIFIYTTELVPTNLRQTLLGVCLAFGRIGSLIAPQAPLLDILFKNLSIYLFAGCALFGGLVTFQFPETLNYKLPDTIEEALQLGK